MLDTRKITSNIIVRAQDMEEELLGKLNVLDDKKIETDYLKDVKHKDVSTLNNLLEYYDSLHSKLEQISFYNFVLYVMGSDKLARQLIKELKNLSLLTSTGLLKYAKDQEFYSKQIISNFLLKLSSLEGDSSESLLRKEEESLENKLGVISNYKTFFAPVGIVREVEDIDSYIDFLSALKLNSTQINDALLMALSFNVAKHNQILEDYELDVNSDATGKKVVNKLDTSENYEIQATVEAPITFVCSDELLSECTKEESTHDKKTEAEEGTLYTPPIDRRRLVRAEKQLKANKHQNPYKLFNDYYDTLLGNDQVDSEEIIEKAKMYLKRNSKYLKGISPVIEKDLEDTVSTCLKNAALREEIYKTTENIERLLAYEIKTIIEKDSADIDSLAMELAPIVNYIDNNLIKKKA